MDILHACHKFLAPEPISPLFKQGGVLDGLNEDLTLIVAFVALLGTIDFVLIKPYFSSKSRWFAIHAVANAVRYILTHLNTP